MKNESSLRYIKLIPNDYYDTRLDSGRIGIQTFLSGEVADAYKSIHYDNDEESITIMLPSNFATLTPFLQIYVEDDTQYNYYDLFISIELSEGFQEITEGVFKDWTLLNSITIPSTLKSINCPSGLRVNINNLATWCEIDFNESNPASNGGSLYLNNVKIEKLSIPETITEISDYAFYGMDSLLSIEILGKDTIFYRHSFSNCKNVEYLKSYASIPDFAFRVDSAVPVIESNLKTVELYGSTIGERAFYNNNNLTKVILHDTITNIGNGAFYSCDNLYQVVSKSINPIWNLQTDCYCFQDVAEGFRIYVPLNYKNTYINNNPYFSKNSGWFIEGFDGETQICPYNDQIWYVNNIDYIIKNYEYPLVTIDTNITSEFKQSIKIWLPDSVTTIGDATFYYCGNLTSVTIPNSVTTIGEMAFFGCNSLSSVTIPSGVTTIGSSAFERCSRLTSVTIGDNISGSNLTSIGSCAFKTCRLSSITIPLNVTFIGYEAFSNNTNLTNVTCKPTSPSNVSFNTSGTWNAFGSNTSLIITVPRKSLNYTTADGWKEYEDKIRRGVL